MSNISNIPNDWAQGKISDLVQGLTSGISVNSQDNPANPRDFGVLKTSCVSFGKFYPNENKTIDKSEIGRARINPVEGSIIVSRMNTPDLVGESGLVTKTEPNLFLPDRLWQTNFYSAKNVDPYWFASLLQETSIKRKIQDTATGTSNSMKNISKGSFLNIEIKIPPVDVQRKIAKILMAVNDQIDVTEKLIDKKQVIKKGLVLDLISPKKHSLPMENIVDILDNFRVPVNDEERQKRGGDVPYYGANGLQGYIDRPLFNEPLILIAEDGGNFEQFSDRPIAYRISGPSWVNNHAHILRAKNYNQDYLFYAIEHMNILSLISGGTRAKLNQGELRKIKVPETDLLEQNRVADIVNSIVNELKMLIDLKSKLISQKQGLMQDLFTGQVRVN